MNWFFWKIKAICKFRMTPNFKVFPSTSYKSLERTTLKNGSTEFQCSILGPLLFNIDICHLFFIMEDCDVASYADDNTPYLSRKMLRKFWTVWRMCLQTCFNSLPKTNWRKCHLLISSGENVHLNIGTSQIKDSDCERLLGIDIDCKLSF